MRKIEELKEFEMDNLIKDYISPSSEITLAQIIDKYDLDIKANQLVKSLPAQITDKRCRYCDDLMVAKIKNRTGERDSPYCKKCGHTLYKEQGWLRTKIICECENCQRVRKEEQEKKKIIIDKVYSNEKELFDVADLSLKDKVSLLKIIKECSHEKSNILLGNKYDKYQSEVDEFYKNGVISVSPMSPIDAFTNEKFPFRFYPSRVIFNVNIKLNNEENIDVYIENEIVKASAEEKYNLFIEVMHHDILARMESMMNERGLDFIILSNAEDSLKALYSKLSYAQIISLCFRVARYYLDKTKTGKIYKTVAARGALKSVVTFYDNCVKKGWQIYNSEVDYAGQELKDFITKTMKQDMRILRDIVTIKDFE